MLARRDSVLAIRTQIMASYRYMYVLAIILIIFKWTEFLR